MATIAKKTVDVLPYAPSNGNLGSPTERWHAVYSDDIFTLDGNKVTNLNDLFARKDDFEAQSQLNNSAFESTTADINNIYNLLNQKADKEHGIHVPPLIPTAVNTFLASDGFWRKLLLEDINAPSRDGDGAEGEWNIDISGNANSADRAEQDGKGQVIASTYIKNLIYDTDGKLVVTRGDNTQFSIYRLITPPMIDAPYNDGRGAYGNWNINAATATYADKARLAENIQVTVNSTRKATLVGVDGIAMFTDTNVYLSTKSGELHATNFDGTTATLSGLLTANTATLNNGQLTLKYGTTNGLLRMNSTTLMSSNVDFTAPRVYNAVWNDYAEWFEKANNIPRKLEPGDIIALADDDTYTLANDQSKVVIGVYTDEFAHVIGGTVPEDGEDYITHNLKTCIPIALAGRVWVKCSSTDIHTGQWIVPSKEDGIGVAVDNWTPNAIGSIVSINKKDNKVRIIVNR